MRLTYKEAMLKYGSDKPDLRVTLELVDVKDAMENVNFKVFSSVANNPNGRIAAMKVPGGNNLLTRSEIDDYTKFVGI